MFELKKKICGLSFVLCIFLMLSMVLNFYFAKPVNAETINIKYYCGNYGYFGGTTHSEEEEINYDHKTIESYIMNNDSFPNYYNINNTLQNTCANVAGANIIGYYDRECENLIENFVPGIQRPFGYMFYNMMQNSQLIQGVINTLYYDMETNSEQSGTSQNQYEEGLKKYAEDRDYSVTYTSVMSGETLSLTDLKNQLQLGRPVSIFLSGFNFTQVVDSGTNVLLKKNVSDANHIVVAYGYEKINYYNSSNSLIASKTYIHVATGQNGMPNIYVLDNAQVDDAQAVYIY